MEYTKTIQELINPDIIEISREEYQVIEHTSQCIDFDKDELPLIVILVKLGSGAITSTHFLLYINEFYEYVKGELTLIDIINVKFNPKILHFSSLLSSPL